MSDFDDFSGGYSDTYSLPAIADPVLTPDQWQRTQKALADWFAIRAKHEPRFASLMTQMPNEDPQRHADVVAGQLAADVQHSALLYRMLVEGKPPLDDPPPVDGAYPAYPE